MSSAPWVFIAADGSEWIPISNVGGTMTSRIVHSFVRDAKMPRNKTIMLFDAMTGTRLTDATDVPISSGLRIAAPFLDAEDFLSCASRFTSGITPDENKRLNSIKSSIAMVLVKNLNRQCTRMRNELAEAESSLQKSEDEGNALVDQFPDILQRLGSIALPTMEHGCQTVSEVLHVVPHEHEDWVDALETSRRGFRSLQHEFTADLVTLEAAAKNYSDTLSNTSKVADAVRLTEQFRRRSSDAMEHWRQLLEELKKLKRDAEPRNLRRILHCEQLLPSALERLAPLIHRRRAIVCKARELVAPLDGERTLLSEEFRKFRSEFGSIHPELNIVVPGCMDPMSDTLIAKDVIVPPSSSYIGCGSSLTNSSIHNTSALGSSSDNMSWMTAPSFISFRNELDQLLLKQQQPQPPTPTADSHVAVVAAHRIEELEEQVLQFVLDSEEQTRRLLEWRREEQWVSLKQQATAGQATLEYQRILHQLQLNNEHLQHQLKREMAEFEQQERVKQQLVSQKTQLEQQVESQKAQLEQQKAQLEQQLEAHKAQLEQHKAQLEQQQERQTAQLEQQQERHKAQLEQLSQRDIIGQLSQRIHFILSRSDVARNDPVDVPMDRVPLFVGDSISLQFEKTSRHVVQASIALRFEQLTPAKDRPSNGDDKTLPFNISVRDGNVESAIRRELIGKMLPFRWSDIGKEWISRYPVEHPIPPFEKGQYIQVTLDPAYSPSHEANREEGEILLSVVEAHPATFLNAVVTGASLA